MNLIFKAKRINSDKIVSGFSLIKESDGYIIADPMDWTEDSDNWYAERGTFWYIDITTLEIITNP